MKVLCVGRNYAKHARELGQAPPGSPIWFWKPDSAIIHDQDAVVIPPGIGAVHHEVELAVRIGKAARRIDAGRGLRHVDAFTVAVDVTARDLQEKAKANGLPWTQAKGFDTFLPLGTWQPVGNVDLQGLPLRLTVNGQLRQEGTTHDMTWTVEQLVVLASQWTTLNPGAVLVTGTPEGVGPIVPTDRMEAEIPGHCRVRNPVVE